MTRCIQRARYVGCAKKRLSANSIFSFVSFLQVCARFCVAGAGLMAAAVAIAKPDGPVWNATNLLATWTEALRAPLQPEDLSSAARSRARCTGRASTAVASATPSTRAPRAKLVSVSSSQIGSTFSSSSLQRKTFSPIIRQPLPSFDSSTPPHSLFYVSSELPFLFALTTH